MKDELDLIWKNSALFGDPPHIGGLEQIAPVAPPMCAVCRLAIWLAHTYKSCMITVTIFKSTIHITAASCMMHVLEST